MTSTWTWRPSAPACATRLTNLACAASRRESDSQQGHYSSSTTAKLAHGSGARVTPDRDSIATDLPVTHHVSIAKPSARAFDQRFAANICPSRPGQTGSSLSVGRRLLDSGPRATSGRNRPDLPARSASRLLALSPGPSAPLSAIESGAALLGWFRLTALGAARVATRLGHHSCRVSSPWAAVFLAGLAVSILLARRRRRSWRKASALRGSPDLPPISSVDSVGVVEAGRRVPVGPLGKNGQLRGGKGGSPLRHLFRSGPTGPPLVCRACPSLQGGGHSRRRSVGEARPATMVDEDDPHLVILSSPLVIGDRVTGVIVVSVRNAGRRRSAYRGSADRRGVPL